MGLIESLNENSGAALALLTLAYVVGTFVIAYVSIRSATEQRLTRQSHERPRIVAYMENDSERGTVVLIIRNVGLSTATDISFSADPPLMNPKHPDLSFDDTKHLVRHGTPAMTPGFEFRSLVGTYGNWKSAPDPTPVVSISYSDATQKHHYEDRYPIDMSPLFDMPASRPNTIHSVAEELKKLNSTLAKVAESLTP